MMVGTLPSSDFEGASGRPPMFASFAKDEMAILLDSKTATCFVVSAHVQISPK